MLNQRIALTTTLTVKLVLPSRRHNLIRDAGVIVHAESSDTNTIPSETVKVMTTVNSTQL